MMKMRIGQMWLMAAALFVFTQVHAAEHGTAQEAVALVHKAIDYYKKNGKEKTYAMINDENPEFKVKDLYVFSSDLKAGPLGAHGANRKMVGKDMSMLKDADGNSITQKILDVANSKEGKGWADYKWPNPVTKEIEQKSTYVERVDDLYFACGIYK
ncbi:MAG TPA: cache domain-containing protein [Burkholderiaceae bacterium]